MLFVRSNYRKTMRCGFTLIEILIVMAILMVIMAIVLPVYISAKRTAHRTAAISNTRQIASALLMYASDFDDGMPHARGVQDNMYWMKHIRLMSGKRALLRDPMFAESSKANSGDEEWLPSLSGYAINGCMGNLNYPESAARTVLVAPMAHMLYVQPNGTYSTVFKTELTRPDKYEYPPNPSQHISPEGYGAEWYNEKGIYGFVDGHVAARPPEVFLRVTQGHACNYDFNSTLNSTDTGQPTFLVNTRSNNQGFMPIAQDSRRDEARLMGG